MDILEPCYGYRESQLVKMAGIFPYFQPISSSDGPTVTVDGRTLVMLGSNNYLGLTHHKDVLKAAHDALDRYGTGCTGSRFLNGNLDLHETMERDLAEFTGKEAALVFGSGFLANLGVVGLLGSTPDAVIFSAAENHASLYDGARMALSPRTRVFRDVADLERQLSKKSSWSNALVVTDGVFSMTGRVADLRGIAELKRRYGFCLYVDDAHGFGVLGPHGRGTAASQGVDADVDVLFGTFSKSLASAGGFIAAERRVVEYLRHKTRTLIFSAGLPPASIGAAHAALGVMRDDASIFTRMWQNVEFFRKGVERIGYQTLGTETPIIPLFIGSEARAFKMCCEAISLGMFATPAVYPAVPKGHAVIRTSVTAAHTREHLEMGLSVLAGLAQRYPLPRVDAATLPPARDTDLAEAVQQALLEHGATLEDIAAGSV
jgi:8-amino-7-oxononanoate synthase